MSDQPHTGDQPTEQLGFIGLGIMGSGMVANLLAAGHDVVVWNRTESRAAPAQASGARLAVSPADVARKCSIIMICVSDTPDVEELVLGDVGILEGLQPGALIVDHSTISPASTRTMAATVARHGGAWIDAPVSGGSEGAQLGTLSVMAGGRIEDVTRARPFMEAFAASITRVGDVGAGQLVKIVNQILVVGNQLAASEALLFASMAGLDLDATLQAVSGGAAGSWMLANRGPQMIERDWRPGFTIDLQQKDLRLAVEAAAEVGSPLLATGLAVQLYNLLQADGLGSEGNHALVKALENLAGHEIRRS